MKCQRVVPPSLSSSSSPSPSSLDCRSLLLQLLLIDIPHGRNGFFMFIVFCSLMKFYIGCKLHRPPAVVCCSSLFSSVVTFVWCEWVTAAGLPSLSSMGPPVPLSGIVCLVSSHTCVLSNRSAIVALLWYPLSVCECVYVLMPLCVLTPPVPKGGTSSAIGLVFILV